jgi:hypothetical protein
LEAIKEGSRRLQCNTIWTNKATGSARISEPAKFRQRVFDSKLDDSSDGEKCHAALYDVVADLILHSAALVTLHLHDLEMSFWYDPDDQ